MLRHKSVTSEEMKILLLAVRLQCKPGEPNGVENLAWKSLLRRLRSKESYARIFTPEEIKLILAALASAMAFWVHRLRGKSLGKESILRLVGDVNTAHVLLNSLSHIDYRPVALEIDANGNASARGA